jgi:hypothetical protein
MSGNKKKKKGKIGIQLSETCESITISKKKKHNNI